MTTLLRTLTAVVFIGLLCGPVHAQDGPRPVAEVAPQITEAVEQVSRSVRAVPGLQVAVVQGDSLAYSRGVGTRNVDTGRPVTPQTGFYVASTTKSFLGMLGAVLAERDSLDLDAPISTYFPELEFDSTGLDADRMSLRDHLTHRAGYGNLPLAARPLLVGRVQGERFAELLGRFSSPEPITFDYSNEAYLVAGEAMHRTTNHSWKTLLAENVLAPLGMDRSTPYMSVARRRAFAHPHTLVDGEIRTRAPKADTNMHAAGGMVATAPDLGRYLRAVMNEGRLNGEQVLPAGAVREALAPQIRCDVSLPFDSFDWHASGLGWIHSTYRGDRLMHHFGGYTGTFSHMSFMPEHDVGVVVLANGASPAGQTVAAHIYDLVLGRDPAAFEKRLRKSAAMTRKMQAQNQKERAAWFDDRAEDPRMRPPSTYTGTYEHEWLGTLTVRQRGDSLTANLGPQTSAMRPFQRDVFSLSLNGKGPRYAPEKLTFDVAASGRADRVEWQPMGFPSYSFERVE